MSTAFAVEGIPLLAHGLRDVLTDGHDLAAREQCQAGTYLAAAAFAAAGSGMHHKICHVLGGAYDLEHAAMHAVLLPHVLGFNAPAAPGASQRIAGALQAARYGDGDGADALTGMQGLYQDLNAPRNLGDLGLQADQVETAAELAMEKIPASNPPPVTHGQLADLIGRAQSGATPVTVPLNT